MGLIEEAAALGADIESAMARFMNNTALYEKMLKKLPKAIESSPIMPYVESGDLDAALSNIHSLKGVTGNLSLNFLYENYSRILDMFREGDFDNAKELLTQTLAAQQKIVDCISKYE